MTHPAAARIVELYRTHGTDWNRLRRAAPVREQAWLDRFAALVTPAGDILDLGCGGGYPIATDMAERGFGVTGIDTAPALLALARTRLPAHHWIEADMRRLEVAGSFAGILAWDSFFHLSADDQRAMFTVFSRHAQPGTALMFNSGPDHGEAIGTFAGQALYHASLAPDEYRARFDQAGFDVIAHRAEDPECGGRTVWLALAR